MKPFFLSVVLCITFFNALSQNDIDALRYSQSFFGGTSRSKAMAGSFGALGADGSAMGINPAGIGLYRKGDINISLGLRLFSVEATHNNTTTKQFKVNAPFDGLTLVGAWDGETNKDNHHALGLSCNQINNFNSSATIEGTSRNKSILSDMLATSKGKSVVDLEASYAGMAYEVYLIDTLNGGYYSFVNNKFDIKQSKSVETSGRVNEWCFNYAYGYQDKLYLGVTLGIPSVNYNYTSTYSEVDDKDSMWIKKNGSVITSSYNYPIRYYTNSQTGNLIGGFKDMSYQETVKTTGNGYNLKLGAIYRVTDFIRLGAAFHTPTVYNLTDTYIYNMTANFDGGASYTSTNPPSPGGKFKYKVITPMKLTGSLALLYKKYGAVNIDYDMINYSQALLQSTPQEFTFVNSTIRKKYTRASNLRIGVEANTSPLILRVGYAMYGSPFGDTFTGDFVNNFFTGGIGYRRNKFYLDFSFTRRLSTENYYMYNPNYVDKSTLANFGTTFAITVGSKF